MYMYIVLHVTKVNGDTAMESFNYEDIKMATCKYHEILSYDFNPAVISTMDYFLCVVLDEHGNKVLPEGYYKKPAESVVSANSEEMN